MSRNPADDKSPAFLSRWSERKSRLRREQGDAPIESLDDSIDESLAESADAPVSASLADAAPPALTDADMPSLETLDGSSDLSAFLGDGISATLRKAALRRVFSAASFNVRDGLNDYDGDYTVFEPLGDTVTADMKFHAARRERLAEQKRKQEAEALAAAEAEAPAEDDGDQQVAAADRPVDESVEGPAVEAPGEPAQVALAEHVDQTAGEPGDESSAGIDAVHSDADGSSGVTTTPTPTEKLPPA